MSVFYYGGTVGRGTPRDFLLEMVRVVRNNGRICIFPMSRETVNDMLREIPQLELVRYSSSENTTGTWQYNHAEKYGSGSVEFRVRKEISR